jgi:helicase
MKTEKTKAIAADMAGRASSRYGYEVVRILQRHAQDNFGYYARCKRAAVLHDWINGVATDVIEKDYTTNPFQGKIGYGDIRSFADTTRFHLRPAIPIANLILMDKAPSGQSLETLLKQLEVGIPADALELLTIPMAFERGECLVLYNASIRTVKTLWTASAEIVANLLGKARSKEIEKLKLKKLQI